MTSNEPNDLIEFVDEEGESAQFEHLMTIEHDNDYYLILMTAESAVNEASEEGEIVIMKIVQDANDEECYTPVEDEQVLNAVYEKFIKAIEEEEDEETEPA